MAAGCMVLPVRVVSGDWDTAGTCTGTCMVWLLGRVCGVAVWLWCVSLCARPEIDFTLRRATLPLDVASMKNQGKSPNTKFPGNLSANVFY